jgi:DNA mismatch repair ATPase MutS
MTWTEQLAEAKARHPGMVLLFDDRQSYWAWGEDAETVKAVGGACVGFTAEGFRAPAVANIGRRDLQRVLTALLRAGHRVALCERVESDKPTPGPVERVVVNSGST